MSPTSKQQQEEEDSAELRWSTLVPGTAGAHPDRGAVRRCFDPLQHPELGTHGCRTLYETFRRGVALNPLGPCMGFRAVSTTGFATPYIYSSYTECLARVDAFAAGLDVLKLVQRNDEGIRPLGLFMKNCMEWVLAEHAVFSIGGATVPLYDTLGPDTVQFVLKQTGTQSVVCTRAELIHKLCPTKASGQTPLFTTAIVVDGVTPDAAAAGEGAGLNVLSYAKVEAVGAHHIATQGHQHHPPMPTDIATFCYTSGTTGDPKGALVTHQNVIAAIAGMQIIPEIEVNVADRHLSYMPLAHIFERVVMAQMFASGASVAFFRGDPILLIEDLQACRPTIMIVAPRVLNKIYDKINAGIAAAGGMKKKIFDAGLAAKTAALQRHGHLTHAIYDRLLFSKISKGLGMDHVRVMISGSAPLSDTVMTFFRCVLGIPVLEGYGQTEGAAAATISHPDDTATTGHVGGPTAAVEIVLFDVPEMGYLHTDRVHSDGQPCRGRGEICVRGPNVFAGYYKDEEKTRETIDDEGWLHSGDIGLWRPDGSLQIIDRKKNIFKLSQGEYVAPEKIENILMACPLIAQCFVHGDSLQSSLVAVVVPDEEPVRLWATTAASEGDSSLASNASFAQICQSPRLKDEILQQIVKLSKEAGLHGFETVKAIHIESTLFSVENDLLTPTFKLKRQKVREKYEREIAGLYASLPPPRSKL